jgi:predicted outer membrane repeat protein
MGEGRKEPSVRSLKPAAPACYAGCGAPAASPPLRVFLPMPLGTRWLSLSLRGSSVREDRLGGAALFYGQASVTFTRCTFWRNSASVLGGGVYCDEGTSLTVENCIISFSSDGEALLCDATCSVELSCCDLYGNADGDWVGLIADQYGIAGNISEHPLFCGPENGDFTIAENSPCAPFTPPNAECDLIGAWPVACGPASVPDGPDAPHQPGTEVTWGG